MNAATFIVNSLLVALAQTSSHAASPNSAQDTRVQETLMLTDFTDATADLGWYVVNDNVMGGRSDGGFVIENEVLRFSGRTNTRGGGFSSIRSGPLSLDASGAAGIRLRVRGDGRRYTWQLRTAARYFGRDVSYWADFATNVDEWQTVDIPFSRFVPKFRGRVLDGPALDTANITGMDLMIYDNRDGIFDMQLKSIQSYRDEVTPSLQELVWKKRVLILSAPAADDTKLVAQRAAIASSQAEFNDRDLVLAILVADGTSTIDGKALPGKQATKVRDRLGLDEATFSVLLLGKDGTTKFSDRAVTPMTQLYALIDGMPMRRRELNQR